MRVLVGPAARAYPCACFEHGCLLVQVATGSVAAGMYAKPWKCFWLHTVYIYSISPFWPLFMRFCKL
jgi:hypothetical protein